jgi:hypothetical protein
MRASAAKIDCPLPDERPSTHVRALHRACVILGGTDSLAQHLGVPEASVRAWLEGREDAPQMMFLAAVEIVLLHLDGAGRA